MKLNLSLTGCYIVYLGLALLLHPVRECSNVVGKVGKIERICIIKEKVEAAPETKQQEEVLHSELLFNGGL